MIICVCACVYVAHSLAYVCAHTLRLNADIASGLTLWRFSLPLQNNAIFSDWFSFNLFSLFAFHVSVTEFHRMGQTMFYKQILDTSMIFEVTHISLYLDLDWSSEQQERKTVMVL